MKIQASEETLPFSLEHSKFPSQRSNTTADHIEVYYVFICHIPDILVIIVKHQKEKKPSLILTGNYLKEIGD